MHLAKAESRAAFGSPVYLSERLLTPISDPAMSENLQVELGFFIASVGDNEQVLVQEQAFILKPIAHCFLNFSV